MERLFRSLEIDRVMFTRNNAARKPPALYIRSLTLQETDVKLLLYEGLREPRLWNVATTDLELREEFMRALCKLESLNSLNFQGKLVGNTSHVLRNLVHYTPIHLRHFCLQDLSLDLWQICLIATMLKHVKGLLSVCFWRLNVKGSIPSILDNFHVRDRFTIEIDRPAADGEIWCLAKSILSTNFKCDFTSLKSLGSHATVPVHLRLLNGAIERHNNKIVHLDCDRLAGRMLKK